LIVWKSDILIVFKPISLIHLKWLELIANKGDSNKENHRSPLIIFVQPGSKSIILNMLEVLGTGDCFTESLAVLDMTTECANPGVKNIAESVFSQEEWCDNSHALGVLVFRPEIS
jgi:hypothetical protein